METRCKGELVAGLLIRTKPAEFILFFEDVAE